jgi:cobalamin biosynthesis Mg chelatase CobN
MQGAPRRQARSSARSFFLLPSVLALLALALFPVSAFAGNSGETVYETEIPSVTSEPSAGGTEKSPTHHNAHNTGNGESGRATGSNAGGGEGTSAGSEAGGGSSEGHKKGKSSSQEEEGNPSTGAGGNGGNGNKPGGGANSGGSEGSISAGEKAGGPSTSATNASSSSGGSSPVVPILIAVVVLAAISIGVVLYRQRKSGQDGSDGRVSSPNAG